jgi:hypothetical protein
VDQALHRLQRQYEDLRADSYAEGRGDEFEELVSRFKADRNWPFDE